MSGWGEQTTSDAWGMGTQVPSGASGSSWGGATVAQPSQGGSAARWGDTTTTHQPPPTSAHPSYTQVSSRPAPSQNSYNSTQSQQQHAPPQGQAQQAHTPPPRQQPQQQHAPPPRQQQQQVMHQTYGQVDDDIVHEYNEDLRGLVQDVQALRELQGDVNNMVAKQQAPLDQLENNTATAAANVDTGVEQIEEARDLACSVRYKKLIIALIVVAILVVIAVIITLSVVLTKK